MNREYVIYVSKNLAAERATLTSLSDRIEELCCARNMVQNLVQAAELVSEVMNGVPLHIYSPYGWPTDEKTVLFISAVLDGDCEYRNASVYPNASNDGSTWGLNVRDREAVEHWCGANWPDREAALEAAKRWVVYGTKPERRN